MKKGIFILFIFSTSFCFAQKVDTVALQKKLILTEAQNNVWLDSLVKINKREQLAFILERKALDTNIYLTRLFPDAHLYKGKFPDQHVPGKFKGCCKPLLIIKLGKENMMITGDVSEKNKIDALLLIKNEVLITNLTVLKDAAAAALYGSKGAAGVIYFDVLDKKSIKLLKNIN